MPDVPLELVHAIAADVESNSVLLQLRLVSKTLNSVATPLAFRVLTVQDSAKSAEALSFFQGCEDSVTSAVREVVFQADGRRRWIGEADTSGEAGRQALKTAFSGLAKFPNLEKLRFDFHGCFQEEDTHEIPSNPSHFLRLQFDLLAALASSPPPSVLSLTLNNVLTVPDAIYEQEAFHAVFHRLQTLSISVLSDTDYEGSYFQDPLVAFWNTSMAHMVRSALAVTSLTLRSDQPTGAYPALSFRDTHLPHLSALTLENFVFEPMILESDVAAFIVAHKATLAHLELRECSIDGGEDSEFSRPWRAVLALFETELGCLQTFVLSGEKSDTDDDEDDDEDTGERDPRFRYTRLDPGWGYMTTTEEVDGVALDLIALESLKAAVKARRLLAEGDDSEDDDEEDDS
ncbi:hypothetical protein FB451DRAFT_1406813 [Mycena latifolia]|nr:hypothetical protein FB451DRAFT_1406813 [Mycena latifolia]